MVNLNSLEYWETIKITEKSQNAFELSIRKPETGAEPSNRAKW